MDQEKENKEWRKKNLCPSCPDKDVCASAMLGSYGSIIVGCTDYTGDRK